MNVGGPQTTSVWSEAFPLAEHKERINQVSTRTEL